MPDGKISNDPAATSIAATDIFPIVQSSTNKKCSFGTLYNAIHDGNYDRWRELSVLPTKGADSETFLTSDTSQVGAGLPVRYVVGGTTYYGVVRAVISNTSFAVMGAPLTNNPTSVQVGRPEMVVRESFTIRGAYSTGTTILATYGIYWRWLNETAYLCAIRALAGTVTGSDSRINIGIGITPDYVSTDNSGDGLKLISGATWYNNGANVNTANYDIGFGEAVEVRVMTNGGTDLNIALDFVLP